MLSSRCSNLFLALLGLFFSNVLFAQVRPFIINGENVSLERTEASAGPYLQAFRPNLQTGKWEVDIVVTNGSTRVLQTPLVLRFETAQQIAPGITGASLDAEGQPYLDITRLVIGSEFRPGETLRKFTLSLGNGQTRPIISIALYSKAVPQESSLVVVRTLDEDGLPLEGVAVTEIGPVAPQSFTSARNGWLSLEHAPSVRGWRFTFPGKAPVVRLVDPSTSRPIAELPSPRMVPLAAEGATLFTGQTIPAPLPIGWAMLGAAFSPTGSFSMTLNSPLEANRQAVVARWEDALLQWKALKVITGPKNTSMDIEADRPGLFAVMLPDRFPVAPSMPVEGGMVGAIQASPVPEQITATGFANPATRAPSASPSLVRTEATVELRSTVGSLSSGLPVSCEITEEYRLKDGSRRILPAYSMVIQGFQHPSGGNPGALAAHFPLRPFQLLGGEELAEAIIRVQVIKPGAFAGTIISPFGGQVEHGSTVISATAGAFSKNEVAVLRELNISSNGLAPAELQLVKAFDFNIGNVQPGKRLNVQLGTQLPNQTFVLARAVLNQGAYGFQPVERFTSGADGRLISIEPPSGALAGIDGGGQYLLFRTPKSEAVILGNARNASNISIEGLIARRGPWTAITEASGLFRLLAPVGTHEVVVIDSQTGESGSGSLTIPENLATSELSVNTALSGPRIVSVSPSNTATNISRVAAVVIAFDKAINPISMVGGGVQILNQTNGIISASVSLNLASTMATILPTSQLPAGETLRVKVSDAVADFSGRRLEGVREFTFTTASENFTPGLAGEVTIYAPGSTNLTPSIFARVPAYDPVRDIDGIVIEGSQGAAEKNGTVILVNESTGQTATILADVDGSFVSFIRGSVEDFISVVLVNKNGSRNQLPATRQKFDDGSVGLFASGGTIPSAGEGAPVDFIVEPGAIRGKTMFKVETMTANSFSQLIGGKMPEGAGPALGAFQLTESGDSLAVPADVSVSIRLADLGLPPGSNPTNFSFVVTMPLMANGKVVHQIVDTATYEAEGPEGGRVRTQSPPFVGMLARKLAAMAASAGMTSVTPVTIASQSDNPHKGETAVFGILPIAATGPLKIGGVVKSVNKNADGTEVSEPLAGATIRTVRLQDNDDPGNTAVIVEGDLVSISDETGSFGFFFRPSGGDISRQLVATHPGFPFQKARSGPFVADRSGSTVVNAELRFQALPPSLAISDGLARPEVTVGHEPSLPLVGDGADAGATIFVTAVDDKLVSPPILEIVRVENLAGVAIPNTNATLVPIVADADLPARKVRQFRVTLKQAGRIIIKATASDSQTAPRETLHAISFGVTRPALPPGDPTDISALRVTFAWPPPNGVNLPALNPITLRFNRALPVEILQSGQLDWLAFGTSHFLRRVVPTSDRREITVFYDGQTTGPVRLIVGPGITGESGRSFDQNNLEPEAQTFEVAFSQTTGTVLDFEGQTGAGVVMNGRFAYALERNGSAGALRVFDFEDPTAPLDLRSIRLGYPTAMALIPNYSLPGEDGGCLSQNLLAMFTGHANEPKFLQLGTLKEGVVTFGEKLVLSGGGNDGRGRRSVAADSTLAESLSQIVKSKWDPPYLGYFELGADVTSIKLINLASFQQIALKQGVLDGFAVGGGNDGVDANGDGDFCDTGDQVPQPDGDPLMTPGMAFSFAPGTREERIEDFDFHAGLGVVVTISRFIGITQSPRFSTVLSAGETNTLDAAFVEFTSFDTPRRVILLPATTLQTITNRISRDIALVTLGQSSGDGALAVIDVTIPSEPLLLNRFSLPLGEGAPSGMQLRGDGLIAISTSKSTLLVDPEKLTLSNAEGIHPSIAGRIDAPGTGVRDFVSDTTGINLIHGGGTRRYVQGAPRFSFVSFNALINPEVISAQPASTVEGFLKAATKVTTAEVTLGPNSGLPGAPDASRHYYVLADIPGGAADAEGKLDLVLSAVDVNGMPQPDRGGTIVPSVVGDEQMRSALLGRRVIDLLFSVTRMKKVASDLAGAESLLAKVRVALGSRKTVKKTLERLANLGSTQRLMPDDFVAQRLSNDPDHPLYNRFLAGPFIVLGGAPTSSDLSALKDQADTLEVDRVYLRPSPRVWVGLPSQRVGGLISSLNPFTPAPSKLLPFVSEMRLNTSVEIQGVTIPNGSELIEQLARLNSNPANPIGSFFDLGEQVTLIVGLLNNLPLVKMTLKGEWQPMLVPGAHEILKVNYADRPLVLVPGFAGSKLEVEGVNQWLGLPGALSDRVRAALRLKPDGSPTKTTFATDAIRFALETSLINLGSIYGDWINHLTGEQGMVEYNFQRGGSLGGQLAGLDIEQRLRLDGTALLGQNPVPNLFVFPYDWRLDNQATAERLRQYVRLALEMHPDADGIDLAAHSNGGLVSRAFMLMPGQSALVKRFITIGAPWLGSPKPLSGLRTGDMNESSINILAPVPAVRAMLQFSPGAHQLLPSREYFDLGFKPLVEDGYDLNTNGLPNEVFTFEGYMEAMAKHFLRSPVEELGFRLEDFPNQEHPVRQNANNFRATQAIGDNSMDNDSVETHHIVGMGAVADTIGQIRVRARIVSDTNTSNVALSLARVSSFESEQVRDGADLLITPGDGKLAVDPAKQFKLEEELEIRYVAGDGTVPIASLVRGYGSTMNFNAPHAQMHALVGDYGNDVTGHNPMLNSDVFYNLFNSIYGGHPLKKIEVSISGGPSNEGSLGVLAVKGIVPEGTAPELSFVIDFGDGSVELKHGRSGESLTLQHRYRQSGFYLVTVGAAAGGEVFGISSHRVEVVNLPPQAAIDGGNITVNLGDTRVLVAKVRDPGLDDRHSFHWTVPGGAVSGLNQFAVPVTFNKSGNQTVKVIVTDGDGGTGEANITVNVLAQASLAGGPNFGNDPAGDGTIQPFSVINGFVGGHPEIIVRFNGHSPDSLGTVGLSVKQEGLLSQVLGGIFDTF
ncbi:MAG: Ig-like domain-containing protein, partial [Verrucomicrobiales bacterium]